MISAILLISCPDKTGITASVTNFIAHNGGNILHADQHIDDQSNTFFMRIEWSLEGFSIPKDNIKDKFAGIGKEFDMQWELAFSDTVYNVAVFVSKHLHCLSDLIYRYQSKQYNCQIPLVISNHPDAKKTADVIGSAYHEIPITKENKADQEKKQIQLLKEYKIDLIILARYHQILSKSFVEQFPNQIINIHHSFLPAFKGESPYRQAHVNGVKLIGATSHYVTEGLDEGPIIEQDTARVSHRESIKDIILKGQDLERVVLNRAVSWHLKRKILSFNNKTVVFD